VSAIEDREECRSQTKRDLEELICQLLGGREAERLYYGDGQEEFDRSLKRSGVGDSDCRGDGL
jgi:ATP-dependent Zn protease